MEQTPYKLSEGQARTALLTWSLAWRPRGWLHADLGCGFRIARPPATPLSSG